MKNRYLSILFASLIFGWIGGPVATTGWSLWLGCVLGAPATWYFARHIRHLMDVADGHTTDMPTDTGA